LSALRPETGRRAAATGRDVRRVAHDEIGARRVRTRCLARLAAHDLDAIAPAVRIRVGAREIAHRLVDLDHRDVLCAPKMEEPEADGADARAEIERTASRTRARCSAVERAAREACEDERIGVDAITGAPRRLHEHDAPAEDRVARDGHATSARDDGRADEWK
jgi:hypothetical protein